MALRLVLQWHVSFATPFRRLKSASYFINTKSETANAVAFHILPPGVQKASFGSFYHPVPNITLEEQDCSNASELCVQQCGLAARHMAATE